MKRLAILFALFTMLLVITSSGFAAGTREDGDFSYDGINELDISGDTFDVRIQGTRSRTTSLEIRNYPDNYTVYHTRSGDSLRVWVEREFSLFSRPHRGELILMVPGNVQLLVDNSTGDIAVRNVSGDTMDLETSTGDILVADSASSFRVDSATGEVQVTDCTGEIDIHTSTGDIYLERFTGEVHATSSTGGQEYREIEGDLYSHSTTGDIEIDRLRGALNISSSTGSQTGRGIELTADSVFETSTGDIDIDLVQPVEELEFDLRSTTGSLRVGREESQRRLFLGGRGFHVEGKSSTGSQYFH